MIWEFIFLTQEIGFILGIVFRLNCYFSPGL